MRGTRRAPRNCHYLVEHLSALFADARLLTFADILKADSGWLAAVFADQHDIGNVNRALALNNARLGRHIHSALLRLFDHVDARDNQHVLFRRDAVHGAGLAGILAAQYLYCIAFANLVLVSNS